MQTQQATNARNVGFLNHTPELLPRAPRFGQGIARLLPAALQRELNTSLALGWLILRMASLARKWRETHSSSKLGRAALADLGGMCQLRFAEFVWVNCAACEARQRAARRVQGAGAAVGVGTVVLHFLNGEEAGAEGAAQAHCGAEWRV